MTKTEKAQRKRKSLDRVFDLAHGGQIPHAIVMWNKHLGRHEECVCETQMFDQKLCGFCLLSRLQTVGLEQKTRASAMQFLDAAETVSGFLMRHRKLHLKRAAE